MAASVMLQPSHPGPSEIGLHITLSIGMLLFPVVVWFAAPFLARLVAGKADAPVTVPVPPLRDLYAFAFVLVGLYFVLTSLGEVFVWFRYSLITTMPNVLYPERDRFVRSLITLVAGAICIIFGKTWAGKLSESKPEP